ncbi:acyl-CoA synthetase [Nocardia alni]|uniref:acyl-CoA synthetase n=1 Tax=Nocardia alni TaxID=2815723 RepID=UPI001C238A84|nr:long-chain fatty acid--CoA ligase [Nocardia alni]
MIDAGLGSWPARRARMEPGAIALVQGERRIDYGTLAARVDALAAALADLGIGRGDRVAYLGPNDIATFETLFAATHLGAIFVGLNTRLTAAEIAHMLTDCEPSVLVLAPDTRATGADAAARTTHPPRLIHLRDRTADTTPVTLVDPAASGGAHPMVAPSTPHSLDTSDYEHILAAHAGTTPPATSVALDDPAIILYTSGTTGNPKGAILTHGNITWNTLGQFAHFSLGRTDVSLCSAPLFHVLGLGQITLPTLYAGGTVVVVPKFDAREFLTIVQRERATAFPLAPTMLQMLCELPEWDSADISSVRCVAYGGSPVIERVARAWLARGIQVLQGYGMTEASPGVFMALEYGAAAHPVSPGVPHFFTETALLTEDGTILEGPGTGELLVKGPHVFAGYWNQPEATDRAFVEGWLRTGDIVRIDPDGWAHIVDRVKDMIISGGENIYPAEVEAAITRTEDVADCAVVAVPDQKWGEVGLAFLVARPGHTPEPESLRAQLKTSLAHYKIPKHYVLCDSLPRNATGKIQRLPLRDEARRHLGL